MEDDEELTTLRVLVGSRSVKNAQLAEFISIIGNKPNEDGITISTPINNNYVTGNLASIPKYYINNISGRKAAVTNHEFMGPGGYVLILVALLSAQVKLDPHVHDCRTVNPLPILVASDEHLRRLDGRRYRFNQGDSYKIIDYDKDKDLIGQYIWIRSPITCAAPNLRERPGNAMNPSPGNQVHLSDKELMALHEKRGRHLLAAAAEQKAEIMILGAFGCGAFQNDPKVVAEAYKKILAEFDGVFREVHFAVYCSPRDTANYDVFKKVLG